MRRAADGRATHSSDASDAIEASDADAMMMLLLLVVAMRERGHGWQRAVLVLLELELLDLHAILVDEDDIDGVAGVDVSLAR